jgi:hypothetical protein
LRNLQRLSASTPLSRQVVSSRPETIGEYTSPWPENLDFFSTPLVIEPSAGQLSDESSSPANSYGKVIVLSIQVPTNEDRPSCGERPLPPREL